MAYSSGTPQPFQAGPRLIDGSDLNKQMAQDQASYADGITAFAGGGQTNAFQLANGLSRISVCVSGNDSVKLPSAVPGSQCTVFNDGAAAARVYPLLSTDTIDGGAFATITNGNRGYFGCTLAGTWYSMGGGKAS
jgi:hypothetical protein